LSSSAPWAAGPAAASSSASTPPRPRLGGSGRAEKAEKKGLSREAIVLGWILRHPARIQPVIGTTNPSRIRACVEACEVSLTREEWYALYTTARGEGMS
jgi:aryl-alcohol dehydrogenase-like predicted oxidoreductase